MGLLDRTRALARWATPWGFPVVYVGWAYMFWSPIVGSDTSVWAGTNLVLFLVGGASPLLAAVLLAWLTDGVDRVRDLGHRLVDVWRIEPRWWLFVLAFWPAFNLVMAGIALVLGVTDRPIDPVLDPEVLAFAVLLSFVLPVVEEIGLRGYWLDELRERFSLTTASIVNGIGWAVWHAPFVLLPGYYANTAFQPELWWWLPYIVVTAVLISWVYDNTRRSILAALVFHGMMNFTGEFLGVTGMYPFVVLGYVLAALLVVFWWNRASLDRWPGPVGS